MGPLDAGDPRDASVTSSSDGGTLDSGRPEGAAPVTVCGGAIGDPTKVPLLDWVLTDLAPKYKFPLGSEGPKVEPAYFYSTGPAFTGQIITSSAVSGTGSFGVGPFNAEPAISSYRFAREVMPETNTDDPSQLYLGWSESLEEMFVVRTALDGTARVTGHGTHYADHVWTLQNPKPLDDSPIEYYVQSIEADRGLGWFFNVNFDVECKALEFDALVHGDPLAMLYPPAPHTRAEISKFLVDNAAHLYLTVVTFGSEPTAVRAALSGSQASAATLDVLDTTLQGMKSALDAIMATSVPPSDYDSITTGTDPNWIIGQTITKPPPPTP